MLVVSGLELVPGLVLVYPGLIWLRLIWLYGMVIARMLVNTYLITNTMVALMNVNARRNVTRDLRTN